MTNKINALLKLADEVWSESERQHWTESYEKAKEKLISAYSEYVETILHQHNNIPIDDDELWKLDDEIYNRSWVIMNPEL